MSNEEQMDVLIAIYLFEDLGRRTTTPCGPRRGRRRIEVQGVVLAVRTTRARCR